MDSSEKVNFMGFLKMAGFLRIHEIYDSHGENGLLLSWSKFQCSLAEKFSSYPTVTMCKAHFGSFWTFYSHQSMTVNARAGTLYHSSKQEDAGDLCFAMNM